MKRFILFILVSIVLTIFVNAQTWRQGFETPIVPISQGCTVDQNTFWLVGSANQKRGVYCSKDGGSTWVMKYQLDSSKYSAPDISFVSLTTGYVGCNAGKILKTTDGGDNWQELKVDTVSTYTITKLHFFDADMGFALCTSGKSAFIYKTTDGGNSWKATAALTGSYMYNMDFISPTNGIASGDAANLYYTTDGETWTKSNSTYSWPVVYSRSDQWGLKMISATTAVSCGWGSVSVGNEPTIFLKTTDGGITWNCMVQADANRTYVNIKSIYFKDELNGISVGGSNYPGTVICRTTDGGTNWIPLSTFAGFSATSVIGFNDKLIVAGGSGDIISSSDFGNSWTTINKHPGETLSSIKIINNNIYACGTSGAFFKSTDSGKSFDMSYMTVANKCLWSKALYFLNENLGYAVSQKGQTLKTTDAGVTWTQVMKDSSSNFIDNKGLYFIDENIGFVAGNYGSNVDIIYKTTDGGGTWSSSVNKAFQNLNCISFADENHGAAGGNKAAILFTTDQGNSWNPAVVNTTDQLAINSMNFYDGLNGIAVGLGIILKTSDGGATWNRIALPGFATNVTLTSVFHDSSGFYTVGSKYCLKSTDNGDTWFNIMDTVFSAQNGFTSMNSIAKDKDGNIWIATGGLGGGLVTTAPSVTGIIKNNLELNSFQLEQNYPNPFNPSTNIGFTINKHGYVTLKLFDVLGRVVKEIFKGEITAGKHNIHFNAGSLASGIYFYSLQVNDQFTCRKMTLLK
jgi:photosystem II stability/assembly factor-like uncharacterized protein